jgi:hypothetical protein
MTKKKPVTDKPNRIQISQTRQAGKVNKTSLFDNIQLRHPYEDIFAQEPVGNVKLLISNESNNKEGEIKQELTQTEQELNFKNTAPNKAGIPTEIEIPEVTGIPIETDTHTTKKGIPKTNGQPKDIGIPKNTGTPFKQKQPVSPVRDFTKTPNSITKYILAHGLFKGKSKQVYDYFWSQSRGNIKPLRTTQRTNKQIKDGTGIGSKNTVADAIKHLEEIGLIIKNTTAGESAGNLYEIFTPEELGYPNLLGIPNIIGLPSEDGLATQKTGYLGFPETGMPDSNKTVINPTVYENTNTSFKDINKNDDEAFTDFTKKFQELAKEVTGQKLTKRDSESLGKLADLLILEFRIAAQRTGSVSSVPAFLTEILRRRLREIHTTSKATKITADEIGKSEDGKYEIKSLDKKGREAALVQLQEFAEDEFLQDFKKWYTEEDWNWLIKQIKK